jgi:hypothetical protein
MYALPPRIDRDPLRVTGISCPDCGGVLQVRTEGRDATLVFHCRINHTYDVPELLAAKEERLEEQMWVSMRTLEELTALLSDLAERGLAHGESEAAIQAYRERAEAANRQVSTVRNFMRAGTSVDLAPAEPESPPLR